MSSIVQAAGTEQIWAEFGDRLRAFIRRRVGSAADADDILQDVFLRIHRHAGSLEHQERLVSWLFQVTRNAITDYYRAPVRRRELLAGAPPDLEQAAAHAGAWIAEGDEASGQAGRELAHCLRPMLTRLPDHYREAVTLIDLDGLSQQDAATRAGLSLSGMKSRVQRGRRALEQVMHDCCRIDLDSGGRVMDYHLRSAGCGSCADGCEAR
jgi:RNA polymerase sigma-70 factor (ECF subfamily)